MFITSNIIAWIAIGVIPAEAARSDIVFCCLLNLLFVSFVLIFSVGTYVAYPFKQKTPRVPISDVILRKNIKVVVIFPILGFLFMAYDRLMLRGIDYTKGVRHARYQWFASEGGHFPGIIGNLMVPFAYIAVFFLISYYTRLSRLWKLLLVVSILFGIFGHAVLNGGRSNVLLGFVMAIIAWVFKSNTGVSAIGTRMKLSTKIVALLMVVWGFYYVSYIIYSSAALGNVQMYDLVQLGTDSLYGKIDQGFYQQKKSEFLYLVIYILTYMYHGQWTAQISHSVMTREGSYLFPQMLAEMGLLSPPNGVKYFPGVFISLPGAFYYDFGFLGVIGLSSLLGIMLGFVFIILSYSHRVGGLKMAYIVGVVYLVILSPILPAYGFSYYYYILYSFIALWFINSCYIRRKVNYIS